MRRRILRLLFLLWLGAYLSGPFFESVDFWDPPQEELRDVTLSAGGAVTLLAAVFAAGLALLRKLRLRCWSAARGGPDHKLALRASPLLHRGFAAVTACTPSPPLSLRI